MLIFSVHRQEMSVGNVLSYQENPWAGPAGSGGHQSSPEKPSQGGLLCPRGNTVCPFFCPAFLSPPPRRVLRDSWTKGVERWTRWGPLHGCEQPLGGVSIQWAKPERGHGSVPKTCGVCSAPPLPRPPIPATGVSDPCPRGPFNRPPVRAHVAEIRPLVHRETNVHHKFSQRAVGAGTGLPAELLEFCA